MIIRELCGCSLITKGLDSIVKYGDHCSKHSPNNKNELIIEFKKTSIIMSVNKKYLKNLFG